MICPVCGKVNSQDARTCDICGARLTSEHAVRTDMRHSAAPATSANPSGPTCPVCRRVNRSTSVFCASCGHRMKPANGQAPATPPPAVSSHRPSAPQHIAPDVTGNIPAETILKGRYRILRKIAQGGMGAVYESIDLMAPAGTRWAVKEISPAALPASERPQAISDFRREAQMLATLQHPNLPKVVETFEEMSKHFLVMEFVPGRTLLNVLEKHHGFLPEERVMAWARQVVDVLDYLHAQNPPIIYRDMKPSNVMLVEGTERIKLIDFGIARFHKVGKAHDTEAFGTAGYAPPEQYGKGQTDQRSDIYALAATLHHLLTNQDPSLNPFTWLPVRRFNPALSQRIETVLQRALNLDPSKRFASIAEFADALGVGVPAAPQRKEAPQPAAPAQAPVAPRPAPPKETGPSRPATPPAKERGKPTPIPIYQAPPPPPPPHPAPAAMAPAMERASAPTVHHSGPPSADILLPTQKAPAMPAPVAAPKRDAKRHRNAEEQAPVAAKASSLVVSDKLVDLGEVRWNTKPARKIALQGMGNGHVKGTVLASHPWIAYDPKHFQGNTVTLEVKVRKNYLPFGRVELHVPNLFAMIWSRIRGALPVIGCWFWVLLLAGSSLGMTLWWGIGAVIGALLLAEVVMWLWALHVRLLVPAEKLNTGRLVVKSSGGEEQIEVRALARPSLARKAFGWSVALLLMLAEALVVIWTALALVGGFNPPIPGM